MPNVCNVGLLDFFFFAVLRRVRPGPGQTVALYCCVRPGLVPGLHPLPQPPAPPALGLPGGGGQLAHRPAGGLIGVAAAAQRLQVTGAPDGHHHTVGAGHGPEQDKPKQ